MEERTYTPEDQGKPGSFRQSLLEWVEVIVGSVVFVTILLTFVARIITVDGSSMSPTYENGDRVLATSLAGPAGQGDVVILVNVLEEPIIKRVVATEGQTVDFDEDMGELVVDGQPLTGEAYHIANGITYVPDRPGEVLEFPQTVPEGCVFVLGDNRPNSKDSRFAEVGMVDCRNILGKVVFNLYPFSKLGFVG